MDKPQPNPSRSRLQALLAIPDRQRTDAEWDEINELEIMLAPGNRPGAPDHSLRTHDRMMSGQPKPGGGPHNKNPGKKFHKRPPKRNNGRDGTR